MPEGESVKEQSAAKAVNAVPRSGHLQFFLKQRLWLKKGIT